MKALSEMTSEELWQLFPIFLVEHSEKWAASYAEMEAFLNRIFAGCPIHRISHIGSTAIQGIRAKDSVDILVETDDVEGAAGLAVRNGFVRMSSGPQRVSLDRGYTPEGFADKVYHLHIRQPGDNDELYFRDYLNEHPEVARAYETLKLGLWKKYEHNRYAYTGAKTEFIERWTSETRRLYGKKRLISDFSGGTI